MKYTWIDYNSAYEEIVDSWLDEDANSFTGCDEGFEEYYQYWVNDAATEARDKYLHGKMSEEDALKIIEGDN